MMKLQPQLQLKLELPWRWRWRWRLRWRWWVATLMRAMMLKVWMVLEVPMLLRNAKLFWGSAVAMRQLSKPMLWRCKSRRKAPTSNNTNAKRGFNTLLPGAIPFLNDFTSIALAESNLYLGYSNPHPTRSEEHTSELQSLMRISYAVFCLKK